MDDIKIREKYDNLMLWKVLFVFGNAIVLIIGFSFFGFFSLFITIPIVYISMMTFLAKKIIALGVTNPFSFLPKKDLKMMAFLLFFKQNVLIADSLIII